MKRVLYLQYANPGAYPPLEHSSHLLSREGWAVFFLGIRARATEKLLLRGSPSIKVHLMPGCEPGWRQKLHYLRFVARSLYSVIRWRPRWLYASDLFSCPAALLLSFLPGLRVVYHEHDFHAAEKGSGFLRLCNQCRKLLARRAEICVVPNDQRAELFKQENPEADVVCVWNCPMLEEVVLPGTDERGDDFWLLYHGSIVPHRLPRTIIQALKPLPPNVKLRVIGYEPPGNEGYTEELQRLASTLGVADRVQFLSPLERTELLMWTRRSNVGLAFVSTATSDINMKCMTGASNKAFDYLASGLALLVTDVADWRKMFVEPGYAMACDQDSVDSLTAALRWFYDHREETRRMGEKGCRQIVAAWNYEAKFAPVMAQMNGNADAVSIRFEPGKIRETVS